jgi:hypothetical protein
MDDFLSQEAQGRPRPNRLEHLELYDGISVYDSEAGGQRQVHRYWPRLGRFLARLNIPEGGNVEWRRTLGRGHYTLWADAEHLLALVAFVAEMKPPVGKETSDGV